LCVFRLKTKKATDIIHSLFGIAPAEDKAETKRPWETWKPPMAFTLKSDVYRGAGQTSIPFLSQRHQFPALKLKIFPTRSLPPKDVMVVVTNPQHLVKNFLSAFLIRERVHGQ